MVSSATLSLYGDNANDRMAALVDASPDAILGVAPDGSIRTWNRGAELLYGYASAEILGRPVATLSGPERLTEWNGMLDRLRGFEVVDHYETLHKHKDGHPIVVSITAFLVPEYAEASTRTFGFAAIVRDISPQKLVEQALRETERQYRQIVETAEEGIIGIDPQGTINFVNRQIGRMLGYSVPDMLGKPMHLFMPPEDKDTVSIRLADRRKGRSSRSELRLRHRDGDDVWTLAASTPVFDDQRRFQGSFSMLTDITARLTAERSLRESATQLEEVSRQLVTLQAQEHKRISLELGEDVSKDLTALILILDGCVNVADSALQMKIVRAEEKARAALERVRSLAASVGPLPTAETPTKLTRREREILAMAAAGSTNPQIGVRLSISARTVETHRRHIMQKLSLSNQTDLVRFAIRYGFVGLGN